MTEINIGEKVSYICKDGKKHNGVVVKTDELYTVAFFHFTDSYLKSGFMTASTKKLKEKLMTAPASVKTARS